MSNILLGIFSLITHLTDCTSNGANRGTSFIKSGRAWSLEIWWSIEDFYFYLLIYCMLLFFNCFGTKDITDCSVTWPACEIYIIFLAPSPGGENKWLVAESDRFLKIISSVLFLLFDVYFTKYLIIPLLLDALYILYSILLVLLLLSLFQSSNFISSIIRYLGYGKLLRMHIEFLEWLIRSHIPQKNKRKNLRIYF